MLFESCIVHFNFNIIVHLNYHWFVALLLVIRFSIFFLHATKIGENRPRSIPVELIDLASDTTTFTLFYEDQ